jgi:hypothetical protein
VVQPFRTGTALTSYYHVTRAVPFVYMAPAGTAPATGWPLVIFQHGITSQKESVFTIAQTLASVGYAVVAIDMPLHGELATTAHTVLSTDSATVKAQKQGAWGQDFMAVGAPLTGRANFQQAAVNLNRLEFTVRTGGFVGLGAAMPALTGIRYVGHSLGAMVGAYYLAGNTTLDPAPGHIPYTQTTLNGDMKGYLAVPGGRTAYVIQNSPAFGATIDAGLAAVGIAKGTPTYHQFFLVTQAVLDACDPATMTTPLATGLPSRLSNRIVIQESVSSTFGPVGTDGYPTPTNGDTVITNPYTRYFGNALGGRAVLGLGAPAALAAAAAAVAPNFSQLAYSATAHPVAVPSQFMLTLSSGAPAPKVTKAAVSAAATGPTEGYFQFDQAGIGHSSLLDLSNPTNSLGLTQKQMRYFLGGNGSFGVVGTNLVVDPYFTSPALPAAPISVDVEVKVPETWGILGH